MKRRIKRSRIDFDDPANSELSNFIDDIQAATSANDMDIGICVVKHKNGSISVVTTEYEGTEALGSLEVGKQLLFKDMYED